MRIGVLGTGTVGTTLASALVRRGHQVRLGGRTERTEPDGAWAAASGGGLVDTYESVALHSELLINATKGSASLEALHLAGAANLDGKVLIDVANPLEFGPGGARLFTTSGESLAERLQAAFPGARVVKALNHVNCAVMVDPDRCGGPSDAFLCGNDVRAKAVVRELLHGFGWQGVVDLGDLTAARAMEPYVLLWIRMFQALGTADFSVRVVKP